MKIRTDKQRGDIKSDETGEPQMSYIFSISFPVEFENLMLASGANNGTAETSSSSDGASSSASTVLPPSSSASAASSSADSLAGVDSGVDSEVSPSSPDSASCYNGVGAAAARSGASNGTSNGSSTPSSSDVSESVMETAETLLALSGKTASAAATASSTAVPSVVFPQHPDPSAVPVQAKGKEGKQGKRRIQRRRRFGGTRAGKEGEGGGQISCEEGGGLEGGRDNLTFMASSSSLPPSLRPVESAKVKKRWEVGKRGGRGERKWEELLVPVL